MVWEGRINEGSTFNQLSLTMDFFPTICNIAGITISHEIDGIDLLPGIFGRNRNVGDRLVYFMRREGGSYGGLSYYAVRKGKYKLVQNTPYEPFQLFNLEEDPQEKFSLDTDTEHFEILRYALSQHIRKSGSIPWQKPYQTKNINKF